MNILKTLSLFVLLSMTILITVSCDPVERTLNQMDALVEDAEENGDTYTQEDWGNFVTSFQNLQDALSSSQSELTNEDYRQLGNIMARYQKVIARCAILSFGSGVKNSANFAKGYLEGLGIDGDDESVDSLLGEYASVVEDALVEVEELFDNK